MTRRHGNLLVRIITSLVALPVVLYMLYLGGYFLGALVGFAAAVCAYEYMNLTIKVHDKASWFSVAVAGVVPLLPVIHWNWAPALACGCIGIVLLWAWVHHLYHGPLAEAPVRIAHILLGLVYCAGGLTPIIAIRALADGIGWIILVLLVTWGNDVSAYFAGQLPRKHRLYFEVSPNKTWEGFYGGLAGGIILLFIYRQFFFRVLTITDCVILGILCGVFGPIGDLCESMLKRAYGAKNSGRIIPGHGGMLDRLDALIFNAPMTLVYLQFIRPHLFPA